MSVLQGASDDLGRLHDNLKQLEVHFANLAGVNDQSGSSKPQSLSKLEISRMSEYLASVQSQFKQRITSQSEQIEGMNMHSQDLEAIIVSQLGDLRKQLTLDVITGKSGRGDKHPQQSEALQGEIIKLRKDFNYLRKPSIVPKAYEASLSEMKRRVLFRVGLDE